MLNLLCVPRFERCEKTLWLPFADGLSALLIEYKKG